VEVVKRFARDWTIQGNYTFSKAIGDNEGDEVGYRGASRTIRNRRLDRRLLAYHRTHAVRLNGIWDLPFGPGKLIGKNSGGILGMIIGGWQLGGIGTILSGQPVTVNAVNAFNLVTTDGATPTTFNESNGKIWIRSFPFVPYSLFPSITIKSVIISKFQQPYRLEIINESEGVLCGQ
jgi:hypothetical protein